MLNKVYGSSSVLTILISSVFFNIAGKSNNLSHVGLRCGVTCSILLIILLRSCENYGGILG